MTNSEPKIKDVEDRVSDFSDEENESLIASHLNSSRTREKTTARWIPSIILALSIGLNLVQFILAIKSSNTLCLSPNAGIPEREVTTWQLYTTDYTAENRERAQTLWEELDVSEGFVSVSNEETDALGVPRSIPSPWDSKMGLYVVHGYHALHCITLLREYTDAANRGETPLAVYHHVEHCLDLLRQDILCYADDQLDWTETHGAHRKTGEQPRQCRDWSKLETYARERNGCYKTVNITYGGHDWGVEHQLDRYTYCPDGSPFKETVQAYHDMIAQNGEPDWERLAEMANAKTDEEKATHIAAIQRMYRPREGNLNWDAVSALSPGQREQARLSVNQHNNYICEKDQIEPPVPY